MLTWQQLEQLRHDGRLVRWKVGGREVSDEGRGLYILPDVHEAFSQRPWPASQGENPNRTRERRAAMRQVLERFVLGHAMRLNYDLKELGSEARNSAMQGYWEFRSQGRMTETRLFGFFARPGAFVATAFQGRDQFSTSRHWRDRRQKCQALWNALTDNATYMNNPWPAVQAADLEVYLARIDD